MLAMAGGALVTASTLPLVDFFGDGDRQYGFQMAMVVLSILAVLAFFGCFALTKEREDPTEKAEKQNIFGDFLSVLKNDQWVLIALITFVLLIAVAMRGAATPYYVEYYHGGDGTMISIFMTSGMLAGIAGAMFANWLSAHACKVKVMKWAAVGIIVFHGTLLFIPPGQMMLALVFMTIANFCHMILIPYLFSAVADTVDYGLDRWGKGAMAMSFSGHLLALKIGIAFGGALTGWILAFSGYQPNTEQTSTALNGILFNLAGSQVVAGLFILACMAFYKLNREWAQNR
jgi:GPH family glycoside/pentoside/hexuronide:cation symporter